MPMFAMSLVLDLSGLTSSVLASIRAEPVIPATGAGEVIIIGPALLILKLVYPYGI